MFNTGYFFVIKVLYLLLADHQCLLLFFLLCGIMLSKEYLELEHHKKYIMHSYCENI